MPIVSKVAENAAQVVRSAQQDSAGTLRTAARLSAVIMLALALTGCGERESASVATVSEPPAPKATSTPVEAVPSATEQLDEIIGEYAKAQLDEDQNTEIPDVSAAAFQAEIDRNRALLERLRAIDSASLAFDEQIDHRFLTGLLESDTYSAEQRRMWEKDASIYIPAGEVGRLLEPESTQSPAARADRLMKVLTAIPQHLQSGRTNLVNPPQRFTEAAIFKTQGTIKSLKNDAAALSGAGSANSGLSSTQWEGRLRRAR